MTDAKTPQSEQPELEMLEMSEAAKKARGRRSLAIGLCLAVMVGAFYAATITKFGPKLMDRPIITLSN